MKKIFFTSAICLLASYFVFSQVDMGLPSVTGKGGAANGVAKDWECIGINPANLGWKKNHDFSISGLIVGLSVQSRALDYKQLKTAITHPSDTFSKADKQLFADLFTCEDGLNMQTNLNWLTFSFKVPKVGGFAMNIRDRSFGHITLNKNAADVLFNGKDAAVFKDTANFIKNISTLFDGTKVSYMRYREMNLAYGTKLFGIGGTKDSSAVSFYGGLGFKYLWGLGDFETIVENGVLTGHSALSTKSGIQYGSIKNFTPETSTGIFPAVGVGTAFDVGMGVGIGKMKITLSAVDMGKITWDKNVLIADDTLLPKPSQFTYGGINSWNAAEQSSHMFNDSGIVRFKPGPAYSTQMLSKFRFGIGYEFSRRFVMGADMVLPMSKNPSNLENAFFAFGMELELATNLAFSVGVAGNSNYGFSMPFGLKLGHFFKIMEVRLATNDLLTYIAPGENPNISLAMSLFCFNLDKKKK
jgi:hypothetical protein